EFLEAAGTEERDLPLAAGGVRQVGDVTGPGFLRETGAFLVSRLRSVSIWGESPGLQATCSFVLCPDQLRTHSGGSTMTRKVSVPTPPSSSKTDTVTR